MRPVPAAAVTLGGTGLHVEPSAGEIPEAECWEKLRGASVGRLALSARALPVIIPVRYVIDGTTVVACMGSDAPFGAVVDDVVAAFSVESIDGATGSGWCVHVQGVVRTVPTSGSQACPPDGGRLLRLEPAAVVGRRLTLPQPTAPGEPVAVG